MRSPYGVCDLGMIKPEINCFVELPECVGNFKHIVGIRRVKDDDR